MDIKIKTFFVAILVLTLLTPFVRGAATITGSAATDTMTNGANVQITGTIQADSGSSYSGSVQVSCDVSSYSIPEGSYSVSLSAGNSVTKTFTFTPEDTGTYTCQVTDGTYSSDPFTISVENPTILTASLSPSTRTNINGSQSFTLTGTIQNSQSSAVTTSYTLTCPSAGFSSCSGDATSDSSVEIAADSSASLTWTVTLASGFTSGSQTITLQIGSGSASDPTCVVTSTGPTTTTTTGTTTVTSGGTGGAATATTTTSPATTTTLPPVEEVKTLEKIEANETGTFTYEKAGLVIREILVTVKDAVTNVQISITKTDGAPSEVTVTPTGDVYAYLTLVKTNIEDDNVTKAVIKFSVEKTWITNNNIDETTIVLQRFSESKWTELSTKKTDEDSDYVYFEAESLGLSVFVVTGQKLPTTTTIPPEVVGKIKSFFTKYLWVFLIVVVVAAGGFAVWKFEVWRRPAPWQSKVEEAKKKPER